MIYKYFKALNLMSLMVIALFNIAKPAFCDAFSQKQPTVDLRVKVDGNLTKIYEPISLKAGDSVQLKVEALHPDGTVNDITDAPETLYVPAPDDILSVSETGLVTAEPDLKYSASPVNKKNVILTIAYRGHSENVWGLTTVMFDVIVRERDLILESDRKTLGVGETTQLKVLEKLPDGTTLDITEEREEILFYTTDEFMLVPEPDGRVTCIGTRGRPKEFAIVGVIKGEGNDSMRFNLLGFGPGPGLEVVSEKMVLREGESTQLHVYKTHSNGQKDDLTSTSTGTTYLTFPGSGKNDPSVIEINESGKAKATDSIGDSNRHRVSLFVRNGDDVGWIDLTVIKDS